MEPNCFLGVGSRPGRSSPHHTVARRPAPQACSGSPSARRGRVVSRRPLPHPARGEGARRGHPGAATRSMAGRDLERSPGYLRGSRSEAGFSRLPDINTKTLIIRSRKFQRLPIFYRTSKTPACNRFLSMSYCRETPRGIVHQNSGGVLPAHHIIVFGWADCSRQHSRRWIHHHHLDCPRSRRLLTIGFLQRGDNHMVAHRG
jgi:hypothetical protein